MEGQLFSLFLPSAQPCLMHSEMDRAVQATPGRTLGEIPLLQGTGCPFPGAPMQAMRGTWRHGGVQV